MLLLDRQAWMHSAKMFLAAILALWIGLRFNLPRPYWAMTTAYVVMQPVLGGTRSRGIYRIAGTVLASVAVVIMVPVFVQVPVMLSLAMSLWLSACLCVALLHRGPSAYVFMLAGYTAAFIGFPAAAQSTDIFNTAMARSEEIIVGSLCAVIVGAVVFPASIQPTIRRRVDELMRNAALWCAQVLEHNGSPGPLRKRMAGDLTQLDLLIPFAGRDDPRHGHLDVWLRSLRASMLALLPVLASVENRLENLDASVAGTAALRELLDDLKAWVVDETPPEREALQDFLARAEALRPVAGRLLGSDDLLLDSLLLRLKELAELWHDSRHLQQSIADGTPPPAPAFGFNLRSLSGIGNRHRDWVMLGFASLAPGVTLFSYCLLWIALGWPQGTSGAMMAAVAAAFFAAQDDPVPNILAFMMWAAISIVFAGIYIFGVLPAVHDFVPLVMVIAPFFLLSGLLTIRPRTFLPGMILLTNCASLLSVQNESAFILSSQSVSSTDFSVFANSSISTLVGILFAAVVTRVFRSVGAEWSARRLIRQGWQSIAMAAKGHGKSDRDRFMARMLDLLGLLAPRLASLPEESDLAAVDMLDEIRIGLNILNLRRARVHLPVRSQENLNRLLDAVSMHYQAQVRAGHPVQPNAELHALLTASLARLQVLDSGRGRDDALLGLIGLRYGLFPEVPAGAMEVPVG